MTLRSTQGTKVDASDRMQIGRVQGKLPIRCALARAQLIFLNAVGNLLRIQ